MTRHLNLVADTPAAAGVPTVERHMTPAAPVGTSTLDARSVTTRIYPHQIEAGDILVDPQHLGQRIGLPLLCDGMLWYVYDLGGRLITTVPASCTVTVMRSADWCPPHGIDRPEVSL
jgi:hypothetical protein